MGHKPAGHTTMLRVETFYHAHKEKTDAYILDLIVWLHHFINISRRGKNFSSRSPIKSPVLSSSQNSVSSALPSKSNPPNSSVPTSALTQGEQEMLRQVELPKRSHRISKSQDFDMGRPKILKHSRLSKSCSSTPTSMSKTESRKTLFPVIDFDINRIKALDIIDRVDSLRKL